MKWRCKIGFHELIEWGEWPSKYRICNDCNKTWELILINYGWDEKMV